MILESYGPDVAFVNGALARVFDQYAVDASRVAVGGFSDGASYALSVGMSRGRLFRAVLAFSPGFAAPFARAGFPRLFVAHGAEDRVLPVARCSRKIVPDARRRGYEVRYLEFEGPHTVPADVAREAFAWWLE